MIPILAHLIAPSTLAFVSPSKDYYVTDDAEVLTEATRQDIISANVDMENRCNGAQIVIVTVERLDDMYADEYATQLFNDWGVGAREANNGMLLLLVTEEFRGWLVVGAGISNSFTNNIAEEYLDTYFWPDVDNRNYDTAVRNICEALFSWFAEYYGVNQQIGRDDVEHKQAGQISVVLDGRLLKFDVPPQIINGRTLVPLRAICEELGASIDWVANTKTVTATKDDIVIVLTIGNSSPKINGRLVSIDQPGIIVDGRTLVPLRFVAESFGVKVDWNGNEKIVTITS